jgi:hypothetical protein
MVHGEFKNTAEILSGLFICQFVWLLDHIRIRTWFNAQRAAFRRRMFVKLNPNGTTRMGLDQVVFVLCLLFGFLCIMRISVHCPYATPTCLYCTRGGGGSADNAREDVGAHRALLGRHIAFQGDQSSWPPC